MNKKVLALALAAFVAAGTTTISAANDNDNTCTEQTKCQKDGKKECKKNREGKEGKARMGHKGHHGHANLFEGVELSAEQKTAIKSLKEQQKANEQTARQKNHEGFMAELRNILSPEQFEKVEQNALKMKEARAARQDGAKDSVKTKGEKRRGHERHMQKDGKQKEPRS